jgi:hypothetical protein
MPKAILTAALAVLLFPATVLAQATRSDTIACGLASARGSAEGVAHDFTRLLQLTGDVPARATLIRRGGERLAVPCGETMALGERWYESPSDTWATLLPIRADMGFNTRYPRGANDGPLWAGRGLAAGVRGGIELRYGAFSAALAPTAVFAENRGFARPERTISRLSPFAYPWHGGSIDWPQRPGSDSWSTLDPGQSFVRVDAYGLAAGVSTENLWWGPALFNPLLLGNNAAGFPHFFVGTSGPLDIRIGTLDFDLVWGRLTESDWFDGDPDNDHRLISGLVVDFEPVFAPGLYLGAARMYLATIPPDGFGVDDFFLQPYRGIRDNLPGTFAGDNQLISVFGRFVAPGAGLEAWAEWAREDHWADFEDFAKQPDHSQAYTLGVQKVVDREDGWLRLYGELTHLQSAITIRSFRPGANFYTNSSVRQGHTHRGQLLAAGIGPGSDMQVVGGDWLTTWGRSGLFFQRTRYDDDAYYANFARFYAQNGHDVELTVGARQRLFLGPVDLDWELTYSHRYNRNFVGFEAANFDVLFSERNWGIRLGASWVPRLALLSATRTTPSPQ